MINLDRAACPTLAEIALDMDQRKHPRHMCMDGGVMRLSIRPEFRGRRALLIDVSSGGIGFLLKDPLEAGAVLVFELQGPPGMEAIGRVARVRHSRPHPTPPDAPWLAPTPTVSRIFRSVFGMKQLAPLEQAWLVGCEFDRPLEEDEVSQFLERLKSVSGDPG